MWTIEGIGGVYLELGRRPGPEVIGLYWVGSRERR